MTPPHLPPRERTRLGLRLTAGAAAGFLELPVCRQCGTVLYPVREICAKCLSDDVVWQRQPGGGTVLATTALAHSLEPFFRGHLPWPIGTIQLDVGPVVIAHLGAALTAGARVTVSHTLDRAGAPVLLALPSNAPSQPQEARLSDPNRTITGKTVLITGANRGIGSALVQAFAAAGAGRILAAARDPASVAVPAGAPVEPIEIDLAQRRVSVGRHAGKVDILVNNAGANFSRGVLQEKSLDHARTEMQVNYFGPLALIRAVAPAMRKRGSGVIVNMLTILSHVSIPMLGTYCASKAAAWSMTQALRGELSPRGIRVIGIFPGAVDTRMSEGFPPPKLAPGDVAKAVIDAIQNGLEDVYPGAMAEGLLAGLRADPKAVERELGGYLPAD